MALPEPITRLEQYWKAILDKVDGGGGGGGNPNYVEVIEGTIGAPFGNMAKEDIKALLEESVAGNCSLELDMPNYGYPLQAIFPGGYNTSIFSAGTVRRNTAGVSYSALEIDYYYSSRRGLTLSFANKVSKGFDSEEVQFSEYDPTTPCTLTIIHHPLPTNG